MPFSVLLGTPIAVFGAFGTLWLFKLVAPQASENDVFAQIGLVMLIGLSAKNAILIVEFAKDEYEQGKSLMDAALAAAKLRLRPILMTAFAFILGVVPLFSSRAPARTRRILLGLAVFGGMLAASVIAIFLIPVSFYVVETSGASSAGNTRSQNRAGLRQGLPRRPATGNSPIRPRGRLCRQPLYLRAEVTEEGTEMNRERDGEGDAGKGPETEARGICTRSRLSRTSRASRGTVRALAYI